MNNKITIYLTVLLIIFSGISIYANDSIDNRKIIYKPQNTSEKIIKSYNDTSTVYKYVAVDKDAKLLTPTNGVSLHKYIMSKIKINSAEIPSGNILTFYYNIDEEGNIKDLDFKTRVTPYIEQQVVELINSMEYSPAVKDNKNVSVEIKGGINFPFFKRPAKVEAIENTQWLPEFIGGESKMYKYIQEYLRYPKTTDQGRSVIQFIVTKKGKVKDVNVLKSSGSKMLDDEAKMVVARMPSWEPGLKDGKPVEVYFTIPIIFKRP